MRRAVLELSARDNIMAQLANRFGPCRIPARTGHSHFAFLTRSILYQQLAGAAARTIHDRFAALLMGQVTAQGVLALTTGQLRSAGVSENKTRAIQDLAQKAGELDLERIARKEDEAIIERLTEVRGIGRWTAEMFLIFQLRRLDVWPTLDYGVRKGYQAAYGLRELPDPKRLLPLGDRFRPHRSVAAWYCWRAADEV
jgi:3-methyladenine DNA glycosylase/8-oxoguanine DNA glycosylase